MKKLLTTLLLSALLTNCVNTRTTMISSNDAISLKEKTITITHDKKPSFAEFTPGKMLASILVMPIGFAWIIHDGNKLVRENSINDPAVIISNDLANKLEKNYKSKIIDEKEVANTNISVEDMSDRYRNSSDYVLDVRTINWGINYAQYNINQYHVLYSSKLRLIDVKAKKLIAEGFCSSQTTRPQYYDWFIQNNAAALKDTLQNLANFCTTSLGKKVFGFE